MAAGEGKLPRAGLEAPVISPNGVTFLLMF